jgi:hypothetical protein
MIQAGRVRWRTRPAKGTRVRPVRFRLQIRISPHISCLEGNEKAKLRVDFVIGRAISKPGKPAKEKLQRAKPVSQASARARGPRFRLSRTLQAGRGSAVY